jgi:hypothetical protein
LQRKWFTWVLAGLLVLAGLCLITSTLLPYTTLKSLADSLTQDHNFNSLKPTNTTVFKAIFGVGGILLLGLAVLTALRRWDWVVRFWKSFWRDLQRSLGMLRLRKRDLGFAAGLGLVTILAVIFRLEKVNSPLVHDEAYTYLAFSRSLFTALTDYSKPNNHILHSILVNISTRAFGMGPWAVRLPALLAGVLLVPASYWLAARLYDRWTALGAAFLVAWFPPLVAYANNARGYTMVALFTVLVLALGDHVRHDKNLFYWGGISLFSALGLYTVPVMLFPFGMLFAWLFLDDLVSGPGPYRTKWEFLKYWLAAGLGAAVLTLLFYTPILVFTGPQKVFANDMLAPVLWKDLLATILVRFSQTWVEWTTRVAPAVQVLLIVGWVLGLVFHWKIARSRIPLQLAALLWFAALLVIQRPNAEPRFWSFMMPVILIWASAGIFSLLGKVRLKFAFGISLAAPLFGLLLVYGLWHAAWLTPQLPTLWAGRGKQENAVLFIQNHLQPGDLIVVSSPDDAPVWYYSNLHGIPDTFFNSNNAAYQRILVLVDTQWHETLPWVIADRGPDEAELDVQSAQLMGTIGSIQIYEVPHK